VWGIYPLMVREFTNTDEMMATAVQAALERGLVEQGDIVVITAGVPMGGPGKTNMIKIHVVGESWVESPNPSPRAAGRGKSKVR